MTCYSIAASALGVGLFAGLIPQYFFLRRMRRIRDGVKRDLAALEAHAEQQECRTALIVA